MEVEPATYSPALVEYPRSRMASSSRRREEIFGGDESRALEVARRVDSGSVGINFFGSNHAAPFGGRHDSGMGVEYGVEGLSAYLSYKSIHRTVR